MLNRNAFIRTQALLSRKNASSGMSATANPSYALLPGLSRQQYQQQQQVAGLRTTTRSSISDIMGVNNSLLYNDTVPITDKGQVMDKVYCKVADRYDTVLNVLSLFMNTMWKRRFVQRMAPAPGARLLDVAGGTCEIAKHYLEYQDSVNRDSASSVHVVDFNEHMLKAGEARLGGTPWMREGRVTFAQGDAEDLANVPDNSVDIYSISAGMHNLAHPERALSAAYRVLKPGGRFACLEYGHVDTPLFGSVCRWYLAKAVPMISQLLYKDGKSYERLATSVLNFPHQAQFVEAIRRAGFHMPGRGYELFQCGMMVAYIGTKPVVNSK
ncbi:2-hexaprenyl-6-methoxy-1,4-benzoquinone methyltransferase [Kickxella alabastrina]|nr:2-hexaprenyl-6-methoxy-1,4-benzoquinone methyltransferase [Kickxella alabastrina]